MAHAPERFEERLVVAPLDPRRVPPIVDDPVPVAEDTVIGRSDERRPNAAMSALKADSSAAMVSIVGDDTMWRAGKAAKYSGTGFGAAEVRSAERQITSGQRVSSGGGRRIRSPASSPYATARVA